MKTSKEFTERLKTYIKVIGKTDTFVYEGIKMSSQTFYNKLKAHNWSLQEYLDISNLFDSDKISNGGVFENLPKNFVIESKISSKKSKLSAAGESNAETEFLRGQIVVLNNQIDDLIKTIKNFSEKS